MTLSTAQARLLAAVARGDTLKVHRTLDGQKVCRLHPLAGGPVQEVPAADVETLLDAHLLASNMKFPAAAFLLTDAGSTWLQAHAGGAPALRVRNYAP